jgi:hypothetical protein
MLNDFGIVIFFNELLDPLGRSCFLSRQFRMPVKIFSEQFHLFDTHLFPFFWTCDLITAPIRLGYETKKDHRMGATPKI